MIKIEFEDDSVQTGSFKDVDEEQQRRAQRFKAEGYADVWIGIKAHSHLHTGEVTSWAVRFHAIRLVEE